MEKKDYKVISKTESHELFKSLFMYYRQVKKRVSYYDIPEVHEKIKEISNIRIESPNGIGNPISIFPTYLRLCASEGFSEILFFAAHIYPNILEISDSKGRNTLLWAAFTGQLDVINRLIDAGINLNKKLNNGMNILHILALSPATLKFCQKESIYSKGKDLYNYYAGKNTHKEIIDTSKSYNSNICFENDIDVSKSQPLNLNKMQIIKEEILDEDEEDFTIPPENDIENFNLEENTPAMVCKISDESNNNFLDKIKKAFILSSDGDLQYDMNWEYDDLDKYISGIQKADLNLDNFIEKISKSNIEILTSFNKKKEKFVNWNKFSDEGALSYFKLSYSETLKSVINRISKLVNINEETKNGESPLTIALECKNTYVEKYLKDKGGINTLYDHHSFLNSLYNSIALPSLDILKFKNETEEFINKVRNILDQKYYIENKSNGKDSFNLKDLKNKNKIRIFSMDGGGIRCICHPVILKKILNKFPDFLEKIDIFCGCSGSSLVAACIPLGYSINQIEQLGRLSAEATLRKKEGNQIWSYLYNSKWNRTLYDLIFGDICLNELNKIVIIPAYLMDNQKEGKERKGDSIIFSSCSDNGKDRIADICLRSGSAPTYFRCYQGYVDGGVFANNPSICGINTAIGEKPNGIGVDVKKIVCLSIGTGYPCSPFFDNEKIITDGGIAQWGTGILDVFDLGQRFFIDNMNKLMLGERYCRFIPPFNNIKLDNLEQIDELYSTVEDMNINPILDWIEKYWY